MILKDIKIFSQNICKSNFIINTILKTYNLYNIIVIRWKCGQTLGLGLGQIRYYSSIIISLWQEREKAHDWKVI